MHVTQSEKLRKIRSECEADEKGVSMVALNIYVVMSFVFLFRASFLPYMDEIINEVFKLIQVSLTSSQYVFQAELPD
jgi:hypothetical protein